MFGLFESLKAYPPPPKIDSMTMENPPFEDVFPIETWEFSNVMLVFWEFVQIFETPITP